jgi:hypothetical protein
MANLSPAARAVLYDARNRWLAAEDDIAAQVAAAALRAAAEQVVPEQVNPVGDAHDDARRDQWMRIRRKLLAIAAELEASNG